MRSIEHEIDTEARKKVLYSFPRNWEHREMTGRDYGIDLLVEIFDSKLPKGNMISIQLKGTEKDFSEILHLDFSVSTLKYSEIFQSPVILMVCSINDSENRVYYLWLQEYINVILNFDNCNWRQNRSTVRLHFPADNIVSNNIDKIEYISEEPQRLRDFCQLARICSDLEIILDDFSIMDNFIVEDYIEEKHFIENREEVLKLICRIEVQLKEILNLTAIIKLIPKLKTDTIDKAIYSIKALKNETDLFKRQNLKMNVSRAAIITPLMTILGLYNDAKYSRGLWDIEKIHMF